MTPGTEVPGAAPDRSPPPPDLLTRFIGVARDHPGRTAVRGPDGSLTFAELDARSARLAAELLARDIGLGNRVGICLPRGVAQLVALLATWRAGAAYVPLDPTYPAGRLAFMAGDAGIAALIGTAGPGWDAGVEVIPANPGPGTPAPATPGPTPASAPAYVIYTSGSTGMPKGVEVTRGCVELLVATYERSGVFPPRPRVAVLNASISFDASVHWVRVCRGDTVVVLGDEHRRDPFLLRTLLEECTATDLDLTPSHWEILRVALLSPFPDGRPVRLFVGGEAVPRRVWREIAAAGSVEGLNLYGPTECTVDVLMARIDGAEPHLGRPLPDNEVRLLDGALRPVPDGAAGELFVAGPRLATRYVNRPGLTATRFVPDPYGGPGERMYRTGDRAYRSPDGTLVFLGRTDRQVKLRGFRIELEEIEHHIGDHPGVARAAVVLAGEQLLAYVVPAGRSVPTAAELGSHLAARVPEFMVPTRFVPVEHLPMTGSDKLDLAALHAEAIGAG